jgi:hypothetical protein
VRWPISCAPFPSGILDVFSTYSHLVLLIDCQMPCFSRVRRRSLLTLILPPFVTINVSACDFYYTIHVEQQMSPVPTPICLESVLRSSRVVAEVSPDTSDSRLTFGVVLRDSVPNRRGPFVTVRDSGSEDSTTVVTLLYAHRGAEPPPGIEGRIHSAAAALFAEFRRVCSPATRKALECYTGNGRGARACASD